MLFDVNGCVKKYDRVDQILLEFFELRMEMYRKRKVYLEGMLAAESLKLDNIARFILEKIEGTVTIGRVFVCFLGSKSDTHETYRATADFDFHFCILFLNLLPHIPILGSSSAAVNKIMVSKI